ncbi:hypothetical protein [Thermococcus camini]|uniref:Uncharacterized protein n=1 Tax=Thermococcus camini TaxID=2016373 RepID=A0A7G2D8X5_9EURY|nr:hypothetical protein [Thermococcus camini]CAD5244814.1 conserved protein of unknown function [Thermococcus camini]
MSLGRVVKGFLRVHAGFAVVRVNSLGKVYPRGTSVEVLELLHRRFGKK